MILKAETQVTNNTNQSLKRIGIAGFLFFLIKGLVWVGIAVWAYIQLRK